MLQAIDAALDGRQAGPALQQAALQPGRLPSIAVFGELSVARFGSAGLPPSTSGQVHLQPSREVFHIAGRPHRLFSLRGPVSLIALDPDRQYCVFRVSGDWMNRIEIYPEDYVLLRFQEQAGNGDIVVVEVFDLHPSAMVYQLRMKLDGITLKPQSTESAHPTLEFGTDEVGRYHIYGVVLGVFKPATPGTPPAPEKRADREQEIKEPPIPVEGFLQTFRVFSAIPAGGPGAVPTFTGQHVEVDRFIIADRAHTILNLRGSGRLINPRSGNLIVLQVSGNSMNDPARANIQDGDCVLLLRQDSAEDGDIVAAEIRGEDTLATLKRYRVRNWEIMLIPESTDPEFDDPKYSRIHEKSDPGSSKNEQPFYIRGIALAVFKPYP
jgi:SOS-response transcriptional repressor LexA